uniref:LRRCT domain-containing protein n=1 Tax=Parastrongyloides trichosuri TaxID=131310 RepID=A0A0N4ZN85_PARTI
MKLLFSILLLFLIIYLSNAIPPYITDDTKKPTTSIPNCPLECDCEKRILSNKEESIFVYCYNGNLTNSDFYTILKTLSTSIASLEIIAPDESPNTFQWSDNLNKFKFLKKLSLVNCKIPAISQSVILPKLEHLSLRNNNIKYISVHTFAGLRSLKYLDLSHNKIANLPTGAFNYLRELHGLSLSHNKLNDLATNLLKGPLSLRVLELDGNEIKINDLNKLLIDVPDLERLEINYCLLNDDSVLKIDVKMVKKLKRLGIGGNNLTYVPTKLWKEIPQLLEIDLSYNELEYIPSCAFCGANITRIYLGANILGAKSDTLHPEAFIDTNLIELDLSDNLLTKFNSMSLGYAQDSLKVLHLSDNDLSEIKAEYIHTLPRLKQLHLSDNGIKEIPETLSDVYSQLVFLNLSGNSLSKFPDSIPYLLPSLQSIDISRNRFNLIPTDILSSFLSQMEQVYLYDNPWDCRCAITNLQQFMLQRLSYRSILKYDKTLCLQPELVKGLPVHTVANINDCGIFLGAKFGFTQVNELAILLLLVISISVLFSLLLLVFYYGRERRHKGTYLTKEGTHSVLSRSVNSSIVTRTPTPEKCSYKGFDEMLIPPPPPPPGSLYIHGY